MILTQDVPPAIQRRVEESIAQNKAAVRAMDGDPDCPVAKAAACAAAAEAERTKALLGEWTVDEGEPA